jgi:hypothetical protein
MERSKQCGGMDFFNWPTVNGGFVCGTLERGLGLEAMTWPPAPIVSLAASQVLYQSSMNELVQVRSI